MKVSIIGKIRTQIFDAKSRKCVKDSGFKKNLLMDVGLNALAQSTNPCVPTTVFKNMIVGSGTTPNSTASGGITFTQSGTTVTASAGFFTAGMVGQLFKYGTGTGGAEYYITAFASSTSVTVDTSATVSTPTVATVWAVNKGTLDNVSFAATSYNTTAGNNLTTFSGAVVTHQRVLIVATQASPYTVNEIGYNSLSLGSATNVAHGRFVLGSSDVVGTTQFYQVTIQLQFTYSPSAPTAVVNVGTNINTAGNAMIEYFVSGSSVATIQSNGNSTGSGTLDCGVCTLMFPTASYSQNASIQTSTLAAPANVNSSAGITWSYNSVRGQAKGICTVSTTTAGQTITGIALYGVGSTSFMPFDIKLSTPQTLPNGTFSGTVTFYLTYGRNLSN